MNYGQTSHDNEDDDDLEERIEDVVEDMDLFPRKFSSNVPRIGLGVKIPDTASKMNRINTKGFPSIKIPDTSVGRTRGHDSTPKQSSFPNIKTDKSTRFGVINSMQDLKLLGNKKKKF